MDIGVWMSAEVLEHKLKAREERNPEQTWNLTRWPKGFTQEGDHRLYVASGGNWRATPAAPAGPADAGAGGLR